MLPITETPMLVVQNLYPYRISCETDRSSTICCSHLVGHVTAVSAGGRACDLMTGFTNVEENS